MRGKSIPIFYDEKSAASTQYVHIVQGIRTAANRRGAQLRLISEHELERVDMDALPPVAIVTGASMPHMQRAIAKLAAHGRRAVLAGTDSEQFGHAVSCATPSRRTETQQLVNYLYNCGRSRIALVGFGHNSINDTFRLHAAMSAVASWGDFLSDADVCRWQHDPSESFEQFFARADQYDAVICPNDIMSICFVNACKARGVRVPEDVYLASFGNMSIGRYFTPSLTSMTMDMLYVGEQAFHVFRFLMDNEGEPETMLKITVPSRIVVRESTAMQQIEAQMASVSPALREDLFYDNATISVLVGIEHCISQRDTIDMRIMKGIMAGHSYEHIAHTLFISGSTLRYRLGKIFADAGVSRRHAFESLIHAQLGAGNPFETVD